MAKMIGVEKFVDRLNRLPQEVRQVLEVSLKAEVEALVASIKNVTPVSELEDHPGQLRDSIEYYPNPNRPLSYRIIVGARDRKGRRYGRYVEFGHTTLDGRYVPAQPFFFPMYRARKAAMRRRIQGKASRVLKKLLSKG